MAKTITLSVRHEDGTSEVLSESSIACPPTGDRPIQRYEVTTNNLRIRSLPSTSGAVVGHLQAGDQVEAIGEDENGGLFWVQLGKARWAARGNPNAPFLFMLPLGDTEPEPEPEPDGTRRWPSGRWGAELRQNSSQRWWQPTRDGNRLNFTGVCMRPAAFAGIGIPPFELSTMHRLEETLKKAKETGFNEVRFYATLDSVDDPAYLVARVRAFLDLLQQHGLYGYVCVTDAIRAFHNLKADVKYYKTGHQGGVWIRNSFFAGGYNENYLPFLRLLLEGIADHPAFVTIEPMNEWSINYERPGTTTDWQNALAFMNVFCETVQELAPHVYVADGLLSIEHTTSPGMSPMKAAEDLFAIENLHAHTFHMYEEKGVAPGEPWKHQDTIEQYDVTAAHKGDVMLWWTELGPHNENPHLTKSLLEKMDQMVIPHHITKTGQWGFWFGDDVNTTDKEHGFSNPFYHQWDGTHAWYYNEWIPFTRSEQNL